MFKRSNYVMFLALIFIVISVEAADYSVGFPLDEDPCVTSHYGWRDGAFHYGLDLWSQNIDKTSTLSVADGIVIRTGYDQNAGNFIIIRHPHLGIISKYSHLNLTFVSRGDRVWKSSSIGTPGNTGNSTGIHLHVEIKYIYSGKRINPITFFNEHGIYLQSCGE